MARAPRLPGSAVERAAADQLTPFLEAAGLAVTRHAVPMPLRLPTRQDLQAFAGPGEPLAFLERFEVFDPDARPAWTLPPVYEGAGAGDVRAALVDVGAGAAADYERLASQRIEVRGLVALARSDAPPGVLAAEAAARGVAALLVERPLRTGVPTWPEGPYAADRHLAGGALPPGNILPAAPVRASEAAKLRERLRARRVRGASGATETWQVGPGPVEVRLGLEVATRETEALALVARDPDAGPATALLVAPLATTGVDVFAAAETIAALHGTPAVASRGVVAVFGPRPPAELANLPSLLPEGATLGALLAYEAELRGTSADGFTLWAEHLDPDAARLRGVAAYLEALARATPEERAGPAGAALRAARLPWLARP